MTLLHRARSAARHLGVDVARFPRQTGGFRLGQLLIRHGVDVVLDVGAHMGGYASALRDCGYKRRIVSFEPVREHHEQLAKRAGTDPMWTTRRCALGSTQGTAPINVAGNAGASSSLAPMLAAHVEAAPNASYVRTEPVEVRRLDRLWPELVAPGESVFLKLDVQGFEKQVLEGTGCRLDDCAGLQLEMSLVPLYEGGMLYREALDLAEAHGFELMQLLPGFSDTTSGRMYQCDAVFFREEAKGS